MIAITGVASRLARPLNGGFPGHSRVTHSRERTGQIRLTRWLTAGFRVSGSKGQGAATGIAFKTALRDTA